MATLTFHGAARTVTGSCTSLKTPVVASARLRLYQGAERKRSSATGTSVPPATITDVVLSHAHIDHTGNLPTLYRKGFRGNVHATYATRDLCSVMLLDSAYIQEKEIEFVNKRRERKGEPPFNPLYTRQEALDVMTHFVAHGYRRPFDIGNTVVEYRDAGHILGSASVTLKLDGSGTLGYSGDVGRKDLPVLRDPVPFDDIDWLITESTYGTAPHRQWVGTKSPM